MTNADSILDQAIAATDKETANVLVERLGRTMGQALVPPLSAFAGKIVVVGLEEEFDPPTCGFPAQRR